MTQPTLDEIIDHHEEAVVQTLSYGGHKRMEVVDAIARWAAGERLASQIMRAAVGPEDD